MYNILRNFMTYLHKRFTFLIPVTNNKRVRVISGLARTPYEYFNPSRRDESVLYKDSVRTAQ